MVINEVSLGIRGLNRGCSDEDEFEEGYSQRDKENLIRN